jgi:hypothetical protein
VILTIFGEKLIIFVLQADVAELADARVSEARDGDIVVVQIHSSALQN